MNEALEKKLINILKSSIYQIGQKVNGFDSAGNPAIGEIKSKWLLQSYDVLYVIEYPPPWKGQRYRRETVHENQINPYYENGDLLSEETTEEVFF